MRHEKVSSCVRVCIFVCVRNKKKKWRGGERREQERAASRGSVGGRLRGVKLCERGIKRKWKIQPTPEQREQTRKTAEQPPRFFDSTRATYIHVNTYTDSREICFKILLQSTRGALGAPMPRAIFFLSSSLLSRVCMCVCVFQLFLLLRVFFIPLILLRCKATWIARRKTTQSSIGIVTKNAMSFPLSFSLFFSLRFIFLGRLFSLEPRPK